MVDAVKTTREPGWYWVRTKAQPSGWLVFGWSVAGGGWQLNATPWPNDNLFEEIGERIPSPDELRITHQPAPAEVAEAVAWARQFLSFATFANDAPDAFVKHIATLAAAAERVPKGSVILLPEPARKIAALVPRWREVAKRHHTEAEKSPAGSALYESRRALGTARDNCANTLEAALRAADIIGGEHG